MTYDALLEDELEKEKLALAIGSDALGLKHEMTKVYDENEGQFPVVDGIDLNTHSEFLEQLKGWGLPVNPEIKIVKIHRFEYDLNSAQDKIRNSSLPSNLAERLAQGR